MSEVTASNVVTFAVVMFAVVAVNVVIVSDTAAPRAAVRPYFANVTAFEDAMRVRG